MGFNTAVGRAEYTATAGQTGFTFVFKVYQTSDILVWLTPNGQEPDDVADLLVLDTDYTVSINGDDGGDMTLAVGATAGDAVTVLRNLPAERDIEYPENGELRPSVLNADQNYLTYLVADGVLSIKKAMRLPENTQGVSVLLPNPTANAYLLWNENGDALINDDTIPEAVDEAAASATAALVSENKAKASEDKAAASAELVTDKLHTVDNIAEMNSLTASEHPNINVLGYYSKGDNGGGVFYYDASQSAVNNGGTIINGWVRQYSETIDVKWFGAKGDGITDDTANLQKALNISGKINLSAGIYNISSEVTIGSNTSLFGLGKIFLIAASDSSVILISPSSSNIKITDIHIDGNMLNQTQVEAETGSIEIGNNCSDIEINSCTILNSNGYGIETNDTISNLSVIGNTIDGVGFFSGVRLVQAGTGTNVKAIGNTILNYQAAGVAMNNVNGAIISNNYIDGGSTGVGTHLGDNITGYSENNENIVVADNILMNSENNGIHIAGKNITVSGNVLRETTNRAIFIGATADAGDTKQSSEVTIINNSIDDTTTTFEGIALYAVKGATVSGNSIKGHSNGIALNKNTGTALSERIVVANNNIEGSSGSGVVLTGTTDSIIQNNVFSNSVLGVRAYLTLNNNIRIDNNDFKNIATNYIKLEDNVADNFRIFGNSRDATNISFGANTETSWVDNEIEYDRNSAPTQNKFAVAANTYAKVDYIRLTNTVDIQVDSMTPDNCYGRRVTIYNPNVVNITFKHVAGLLHLKGKVDRVITRFESITFICEGVTWVEV